MLSGLGVAFLYASLRQLLLLMYPKRETDINKAKCDFSNLPSLDPAQLITLSNCRLCSTSSSKF